MSQFNGKNKITGIVLAGGLSRRMGGQDKGLMTLNGKPMVQHVLDRLKPQVDSLIINTNRELKRYKQFGFPLLTDQFGHFDGPLAGIYSAMSQATTQYLLISPCDSPFITDNFVEQLYDACQNNNSLAAVAHDGIRIQPVFALIDTQLKDSLKQYLESGQRKLDRWYQQNEAAIVDFSDAKKMFLNINTLEELAKLEKTT